MLRIISIRNTVASKIKGAESFILKIKDADTPCGRMTDNEVDWIIPLYENGINVPCLIPSASGRNIERVNSDDLKLVNLTSLS